MNTAKQQQQLEEAIENAFLFSVIHGDLHPAKHKKHIHDFWTFCHSTFWSNEIFNEAQEAEFKKLIADHFKGSQNADETFVNLVQRAVLAKRYINRRPGYSIAPEEWLNINYSKGLCGTAKWYKAVAQQRKTVPTHQLGIAILAEAVLRFAKKRNVLDVATYREAFIELNERDLLYYYTNAVVHFQYINF